MRTRVLSRAGAVVFFAAVLLPVSYGQEGTTNGDRDRAVAANPPERESKRIFGIIPNNRTSPSLTHYQPLTAGEKFRIAAADSFDRGTFLLAAGFAGEGQLTNSTRSFGQGVAGYARYLGASYADLAIGNVMTEGIYPALLHEDPRYFRRGSGGGWSRLEYAVKQILWTHTDSGGSQFNWSEFGGNATAVAIGNAYYPDNRTAPKALTKLGIAVGIDMAGNILKEFSPDFARKLSRRKN